MERYEYKEWFIQKFPYFNFYFRQKSRKYANNLPYTAYKNRIVSPEGNSHIEAATVNR